MGYGSWTHFDNCAIVRITDGALLIRFEEGEEKWVPRSQIADHELLNEGDETTVSITDWFCDKEGLT